MNKNDRIYVAGHNGMVGSAIVRKLREQGYNNLILRSSSELDLRNQVAVTRFFITESPKYIFLAAAKVGGIMANNTYRADFMYENIMIQSNIIQQAYRHNVNKLLFLGSSCIYPKMSPQPIKEEYLLTSPLEYTNEPYALAKIAGLKMCEYYRQQYGCNFISLMPTNLYGQNDNYDLNNSHVIPALIAKIHNAKVNNEPSVTVWGDGTPLREFLYVDDLADACIFAMHNYNESTPLNVGVGKDITISELVELIKDVIGYNGNILFDITKPNGTPKKLLDVSRLETLGWKYITTLKDGLTKTYQFYIDELQNKNIPQ